MEKNHYIQYSLHIDSVLKIDKKAYPQAYLEECKNKLKKRKPVSFIDFEIIDNDSDDNYDSDNDNDDNDNDDNDNILLHLNNHNNYDNYFNALFFF